MHPLAAVLVLATVVTVPIRVGIRIPNSVTISVPSVMTMPTATPMPTPAPGASPAASPKPGASPAPAAATPAPLTTQEIANDFAAQISKQLSQTMSASQTKPLVSVELVLRPFTSSTATPSPNSGGDYVATINF